MAEPFDCVMSPQRRGKGRKIEDGTAWDRVKREAAADVPMAREDDQLYDPTDSAAMNAFFRNAVVRRHGERCLSRREVETHAQQTLTQQIEDRVQAANAEFFASAERIATVHAKRRSD